MKKYFILAIVFLLQFSCAGKKDSVPSGIIAKDKMIDVFVDVHLAEASQDNHGLTTMQLNVLMAAKYDSLFKKHDTTYKQFKSSYNYYMEHPDQLADIYSEVVNRLTTMQSKLEGRKKIQQHAPVQPRDTLPHSPM